MPDVQKAAQDKSGRIETMFKVIDLKTGTWAIPEVIAANEEWANGLIWCDMEGFAQLEDGTLILCDETGSFVYCPADRFEIVDTRKQTVINYLPKPSAPRKRNTASPKRPRSKWTFVPRRKA